MGGAVEKGNLANFSWELPISEIKQQRQSNVLPLGSVTLGIFYHRALLFKVCTVTLCDVFNFLLRCSVLSKATVPQIMEASFDCGTLGVSWAAGPANS